MPHHGREAPRRKRSPNHSFEDGDNKRVRHEAESEQLGETQNNSTATFVKVVPSEKCPGKQPKDEANVSRPAEEVEELLFNARPAVSSNAPSRSISYNGPEEAVITEDEDRGGSIETAISIDDDGDEDDDNDAPEELASHLSRGELPLSRSYSH